MYIRIRMMMKGYLEDQDHIFTEDRDLLVMEGRLATASAGHFLVDRFMAGMDIHIMVDLVDFRFIRFSKLSHKNGSEQLLFTAVLVWSYPLYFSISATNASTNNCKN